MSYLSIKEIEQLIIDVPDIPKKGVLFKDITPILASSKGISSVTRHFKESIRDVKIDFIVGIESRGFLFGVPLAQALEVGFIPVRKPGKLPRPVYKENYSLEYGSDAVEVHKDDIPPGSNILIIDDLLATGGTAQATVNLIEKSGGIVVKALFLIELMELKGTQKLSSYNTDSLIRF